MLLVKSGGSVRGWMVASDDACETKTQLDKSALPSSQTAFARGNLEPGNGAVDRNSQNSCSMQYLS